MATVSRSLALLCALAAAAPSWAGMRSTVTARLVACGAQDCLLISGRRASPDAIVRINRQPVEASGGRAWRVRLPVATVRQWSKPFARTIEVSVIGADDRVEHAGAVRLPVGLLGSTVELASLVVHAR